MKKLFGFLMVMAVVCLVGCSKNTPKGVVEDYYNYLQNKEYDKAAQCFASDNSQDESQKEEIVSQFSSKLKESLEEQNGLKSYKILSDSICNDSTAYVMTQYTLGNGETDDTKIKVVKEGEDWKIDPMSK